jgi:hypothetical protein
VTPEDAAKLRAEFPPSAIGKLPKGGVQLDYVGHAATTDRLLQVDPEWTWEPFAVDPIGLPALSKDGDLWIRLTVAGVTRIGVGDGKNMKERIGDAIRNAAMRYGVALDLWAKEDLHDIGDGSTPRPRKKAATKAPAPQYAQGGVVGPPPHEPPDVLLPSKKQTSHIFALFGEIGLGGKDDRDARLKRTSSIVGHDVASSSDLTADEADQVIDALRRELGK